jgi:hypothetical protein
MGASDPSRPDRSFGPVQVLLCALVLGALASALLVGPTTEGSGDLDSARSAADCSGTNSSGAALEDHCSTPASPRPEMTVKHAVESATPTTRISPWHAVDEPRTVPSGNSPQTDIVSPDSNGTARVKFSAACQSGDLQNDLRCIAGRREDASRVHRADDHPEIDATAGLGISGRVLDAEGFGVARIAVVATPTRTFSEDTGSAATRMRTITDSLGGYRFEGLADGEYDLVTEPRDEYRSASLSARAGVSYADLVLVREQMIEITGHVHSTDGEPLEGVVVLPVVLGVVSVTTDRDGKYRLPIRHDPRSTAVTLRFQLPGFTETHATVTADRLTGSDQVDLDARMRPVEQWTTVGGIVTSSDGAVLAGHQVRLRPSGQMRIYQAITDSNGEFTFPAVEADIDYRLQVSGDPGYQDYDRRVTVTVDEAEFAIVVEPYEFGKLSGRMVNLDGSPVPDFNLLVKNAASALPNAVVKSDEDGNFTIENAPAGSLAFVSHSTPSVVVRGVQLAPGDAVHVPLVIDWGEHEIRGLVVDHRGNPVPASRVVLKWTHKDDGIRSSTIRRTAADAQGNFLFSQLGPGVHRLEIDAPGFGRIELDHDASREGYDVLVKLERPRKS